MHGCFVFEKILYLLDNMYLCLWVVHMHNCDVKNKGWYRIVWVSVNES